MRQVNNPILVFVRGTHKGVRFEYPLLMHCLPQPGHFLKTIEEPHSWHVVHEIIWVRGSEIEIDTHCAIDDDVWYPIINL